MDFGWNKGLPTIRDNGVIESGATEKAAAATKLQAAQRGKAVRREAADLRASQTLPSAEVASGHGNDSDGGWGTDRRGDELGYDDDDGGDFEFDMQPDEDPYGELIGQSNQSRQVYDELRVSSTAHWYFGGRIGRRSYSTLFVRMLTVTFLLACLRSSWQAIAAASIDPNEDGALPAFASRPAPKGPPPASKPAPALAADRPIARELDLRLRKKRSSYAPPVWRQELDREQRWRRLERQTHRRKVGEKRLSAHMAAAADDAKKRNPRKGRAAPAKTTGEEEATAAAAAAAGSPAAGSLSRQAMLPEALLPAKSQATEAAAVAAAEAAAAEWEAGLQEASAAPQMRDAGRVGARKQKRVPKAAKRYLAPPAKYQPEQMQKIAARHSHARDLQVGGSKAEQRVAPFQQGAAQLQADLAHVDGLVRNVAAETRARAHQLLEAEQAAAASSHGHARKAGGNGGGSRWRMSEHAARQHLLIPGSLGMGMSFA
eukprot:SAG22_NODE_1608_length_4006_cov_3.294599_3_plen_487_part_00